MIATQYHSFRNEITTVKILNEYVVAILLLLQLKYSIVSSPSSNLFSYLLCTLFALQLLVLQYIVIDERLEYSGT